MKSKKYPATLFSFFIFIVFTFHLISFEGEHFHEIKYKVSQSHILKTKANHPADRIAIKVAQAFGGAVYYDELDAIVPLDPLYVRASWMAYKNEISQRIGKIYSTAITKSIKWENSAKSIKSLLKDAGKAAPYFRKKCIEIAKKTNSIASFGIDNRSIIKSEKSLKRKVKQTIKEEGVSEDRVVANIRDALRGTIIAETPEQIPFIVEAITQFANEEGREVEFINVWEDNRASGYVGVHAKILLPIHKTKKAIASDRNIIVEIQIHLKCIMDGTYECVKEREHLLYNKLRKRVFDQDLQSAASTLLYLSALLQCPEKPKPKGILLK